MADRNIAHPNISVTTTFESPQAALAAYKSKMDAGIQGMSTSLGTIDTAIANRLTSRFDGLFSHLDDRLNKAAQKLSRGNWSASLDQEVKTIQNIAEAWGRVGTAKAAAALSGISDVQNLERQLALVEKIGAAKYKMGNMAGGSSGTFGDMIVHNASENAQRQNFRMGNIAGGWSGDDGNIISRLSAVSAAEKAQAYVERQNFRMGAMNAGSAGDSGGIIAGFSSYKTAERARADAERDAFRMDMSRLGNHDSGDIIAGFNRFQASQRSMRTQIGAGVDPEQLLANADLTDQGPRIRSYSERLNAVHRAEQYAEAEMNRMTPYRFDQERRNRIGLASNPELTFANMDLGGRGEQGDRIHRTLRDIRNDGGVDPIRGPARYDAHGNRMSADTANRFRFAAQNIGFGVDDAIQSYQYGGVKASIRAASNNVTAIAGMTIANPIAAAASVIILSAVSAALPAIIDKFWAKETETEHERIKSSQDKFNLSAAGSQSFHEASVRSAMGLGTSEDLLTASATANKEAILSREQTKRSQELAAAQERVKKQQAFEIAQNNDPNGQGGGASGGWGQAMWRGLTVGGTFGLAGLMSRGSAWNMMGFFGTAASGEKAELQKHQEQNLKDRMATKDRQRAAEQLSARLEAEQDETRDNFVNRSRSERHMQSRINRGEFGSGSALKAALKAEMEAQVANTNNPEAQLRLRMGFKDATADDELLDQQALAGQAHREDFLEHLNPELNPFKRQEQKLKRRLRELEQRRPNMPVAAYQEELRRILTQGEEDKHNAEIGSGQRHFISHGYKVGSAADAELEARMVGNFGPVWNRNKHEGEGVEQTNTLLQKLLDSLAVSVQHLGG